MLRQVLVECEEVSPNGGHVNDVRWIDNKIARHGKRVRCEDGKIWKIIAMYNAKPFEDVDKLRDAWKQWELVLDRGGH